MTLRMVGAAAVYVCPDEGPCLSDYRQLTGLVGEVLGSGARLVAIPLTRLGPDFLRLSSGVAGELLQKQHMLPDVKIRSCAMEVNGFSVAGPNSRALLQKLVTSRIQVAVVGDTTAAQAASGPLRDFVRESNRGRTVWFVDDLDALRTKLGS